MKKSYTIELPKDIKIENTNVFNGLSVIELNFRNELNSLLIETENNKLIEIKSYDENIKEYYRETFINKSSEYSKILLNDNFNKIELFLDGYPNQNPIVLTLIK